MPQSKLDSNTAKTESNKLRNLKQTYAEECARIMVYGTRDFALAKRKAAQRLGIDGLSIAPSNADIEVRIRARRQLFNGEENAALVKEGMETALELMQLLEDFKPKFGGALLEGYATVRTPVEIYVRATSSEELLDFLESVDVHTGLFDKRMRFTTKMEFVPALRCYTDVLPVHIIPLPDKSWSRPPLSAVNGKPIEWVSAKTLIEMIEDFA